MTGLFSIIVGSNNVNQSMRAKKNGRRRESRELIVMEI